MDCKRQEDLLLQCLVEGLQSFPGPVSVDRRLFLVKQRRWIQTAPMYGQELLLHMNTESRLRFRLAQSDEELKLI
jgi:hypothetical protein